MSTGPKAPADTTALYTDPSCQPTLEEWNWLVHVAGAAYKSELSARTVFESELFGMNTYILMSMMEDYLRVPERIAVIRRHATPAELVARALPIGNKRSFINLAAMPLHHLTGREPFVDLGENDLSDGLDDQFEVMKFWREAMIAMRTDSVLFNMDADPPNSSHVVGDDLLAEIVGQLTEADDATKSGIRKFGARLTAYAFLENCDARTAVCDTGPYPLPDGLVPGPGGDLRGRRRGLPLAGRDQGDAALPPLRHRPPAAGRRQDGQERVGHRLVHPERLPGRHHRDPGVLHRLRPPGAAGRCRARRGHGRHPHGAPGATRQASPPPSSPTSISAGAPEALRGQPLTHPDRHPDTEAFRRPGNARGSRYGLSRDTVFL